MAVALLIIGAILIVTAFNNTMGQLTAALEADLPGFFVWLVAIAAILGLGYVPALRGASRWLLGIVALVILLTNYKQIVAGFQSFASSGGQAGGTVAPNPATASTSATPPTPGEVAGSAATGGSSTSSTASAAGSSAGGVVGSAIGAVTGSAANSIPVLSFDPSSYVGLVESGFGGI